MNKLYIYGASGHGLVVEDVARACGYNDIEFLDDFKQEFRSFDSIANEENICIFIAIGNNKHRQNFHDRSVEEGFEIVTLIHPSAIISPSAVVGKGTLVMPNTVVNAKACIGEGVIVNTASVVEHENKIGDFSHISPRVALAGNVSVGEFSHVGIGSCVIQGVSIGANTTIGAGSVVVRDIEDNVVAYGNPCKKMRDI